MGLGGDRSINTGHYTNQVHALAAHRTKSEAQEIAWIALIAELAAICTGAADAGHVTTAVHEQIERAIETARTKMGVQ